MKLKRLATLALLACGASTVQAAGSMSASVSFSNLAFTVSDLTPSDGVAPFYELLSSDHIKTSTWIYRSDPAFFDDDNLIAFLGNASVAHTFADSATAGAQVTSSSVGSQASGPASSGYFIHASANLVGAYYAPLIRITPGTRLTFSGNAELQANINCGPDCYAVALLEFNFGYYGEEGSYTKTLYADASVPSQSFSQPVSLSYANTSTEDQFLGLVVHADAEVGNAVAVPEPDSWALLVGGGLIALGLGQRRRRAWQNPALD